MTGKNGFIEQTAKDYDMEYETVEWYYKIHGLNFYEKLEEFIKDRAYKNCSPCPHKTKPCDARQVDCPNAISTTE